MYTYTHIHTHAHTRRYTHIECRENESRTFQIDVNVRAVLDKTNCDPKEIAFQGRVMIQRGGCRSELVSSIRGTIVNKKKN